MPLAASPGPFDGYGWLALETIAILAVIALGAWAFVRFAAPRLHARAGRGRVRVVERVALEPRRSVCLVEVDGRAFLVGSSEGSVSLIAEIGEARAGEGPSRPAGGP